MPEARVAVMLVGGVRDGEIIHVRRPLPETLTVAVMSVVDGALQQVKLVYRQRARAVAGSNHTFYDYSPPQTVSMPNSVPNQGYDLDNIFTYHAPFGDQADRYTRLRGYGKNLAIQIIVNTPKSREQSLALTKLEEAIFWANAAIARNEQPPTPSQETDA